MQVMCVKVLLVKKHAALYIAISAVNPSPQMAATVDTSSCSLTCSMDMQNVMINCYCKKSINSCILNTTVSLEANVRIGTDVSRWANIANQVEITIK